MIGEVNAKTIGNIIIKVKPEVLFASADLAASRIASIKKHFDVIEQAVNKSANYWLGPAGEQHRKSYQRYRREVEEALLMFQENVADLKKIAQNYLDTGKEAEALSQDLPQDVLL